MDAAWISVRDSLPPYGLRVLVRGIIVRVGQRAHTDRDGEFWVFEGTKKEHSPTADTLQSRDVQYWMPLPS